MSWHLTASNSVIWNVYSVWHFLSSCFCECVCVEGDGGSVCMFEARFVCEGIVVRENTCELKDWVCWGSGLWIRTSEGVCTWVQKWWVDRNMCWQILKIVLGLWVQRKRKRWTQGQGECCVSTANHFSLASHSPKPQIPSKHPKIRREETDKCWWLRWQ